MPNPDTGEIEWYRPDPRAVFPLEEFHVSKSLRRTLNRGDFTVTFDHAFRAVMEECSRDREEGTWITDEFHFAYGELHRIRLAHSVEVWEGEKLVGGVYGVSLGGAFFAESMFHRKTDASKVALFHLVERLKAIGFGLLEVQFLSAHLKSLGAIEIPDAEYIKRLNQALPLNPGPFLMAAGAQ